MATLKTKTFPNGEAAVKNAKELHDKGEISTAELRDVIVAALHEVKSRPPKTKHRKA